MNLDELASFHHRKVGLSAAGGAVLLSVVVMLGASRPVYLFVHLYERVTADDSAGRDPAASASSG